MKIKTTILAMIMSIMVIGISKNAFAADKVTFTANVSGDTAKNGEITVKLDMAGSADLGGLQAQLTYDKSKLQYVSGTLTDKFKTSAETAATDVVDGEDGVGVAVVFNAPSNYNGTIAEIKFKVLAEGGEKVEMGLTSVVSDMSYNEKEVENKSDGFTVKIPMTAIAIEGSADRTLLKGENQTLNVKISPENTTETNKQIIWTSSDEKVAKVDANGVVTAVGGGKAVITATTKVGALTAKASITVKVETTGIRIKWQNDADGSPVEEGKTVNLAIVTVPDDATESVGDVEWTSSDESIAKVDNNGIVTALKAGEVTIEAKAGTFAAQTTVTVVEAKAEPQEPEQKPTQQEPAKSDDKTNTVSDNANNNTDKTVQTAKPAKTEDKTTTVSGSADNNSDKAVKTGDTLNAGIFMVLILMSVGAFAVAMAGKKSVIKK